jgi:hypothetical protein
MEQSGLCQIRDLDCNQRPDGPELFGAETEVPDASEIEMGLLKDLHKVHHMMLKMCTAIDRLEAG